MYPYVLRTAVDHKTLVKEMLDKAFRDGPIVISPINANKKE